jgi:hypothetical protein
VVCTSNEVTCSSIEVTCKSKDVTGLGESHAPHPALRATFSRREKELRGTLEKCRGRELTMIWGC